MSLGPISANRYPRTGIPGLFRPIEHANADIQHAVPATRSKRPDGGVSRDLASSPMVPERRITIVVFSNRREMATRRAVMMKPPAPDLLPRRMVIITGYQNAVTPPFYD